MNIVVTNNDIDYSSHFLKVASLQEANRVVGSIDVLIYNNSDEASDDKIKYLSNLKDRVSKLVYICSEENTDSAIKMMVNASNGRYFGDEFFMESDAELNNLINTLDEITEIVKLGGTNVLSDFIDRCLENSSSNFNNNYLRVVKEAANNMLVDFNKQNTEIALMSETATDIFARMSSLISSMKEERENMQDMVEKMSDKIKDPVVRRSAGTSVFFYPRFSYMSEKSIIRIKEIGDFRFLISFVLGLRVYLESVKNMRPKLIVLESIGEVTERRYEDFHWIKQSNVKTEKEYCKNVVFTNCPSKEVVEKLLNDDNYDTFIVVDRTTSDKDHILNCKGGEVKYAINSSSCIDKFNLSKKSCMTSLNELSGTLLTVPFFSNYPNGVYAREKYYTSNLASEYEKLLIDLRRR